MRAESPSTFLDKSERERPETLLLAGSKFRDRVGAFKLIYENRMKGKSEKHLNNETDLHVCRVGVRGGQLAI